MASSTEIVVPDLGDFSDVEVIEILVKAGDRIAREDGLITQETDKAVMDVPAPDSGVIEAITVAVGDTVSTGSVIGWMTVDVGDTVVIAPAIAVPPTGDTTVMPTPEGQAPKPIGKQTLVVPDLGDFDDVDVIEVLIAVGDKVKVDDPLVTIETDKAAMDVPAVVAGTIDEVLVKVGDKVSEGSSLAIIDAVAREVTVMPVARAAVPDQPAPATAQRVEQTPPREATSTPRELPIISETGFARAHASPSVRKLARELGVDLTQVKGSGVKGRVLHDDVKAFVKAILTGKAVAPGGGALPEIPKVDFAKFGEIDVQALTRIQKISGPRLQASWINLPHVTQHDEADITRLERKRQKLKGPAKVKGIPLTPLAFIIKACVAALQEYPKVNSSLSSDGESLVYKRYCHIGFAADTERGLIVPVIRDADKKDVYELATELKELSAAARDGKLRAAQMQGASFTISSLGGIGGTAFTPIINAPEVAILGVSRSSMRPVWNGEKFVQRLILPLSFSYDHRVIDGAMAVRFTTYLGKMLGDVNALLQDVE